MARDTFYNALKTTGLPVAYAVFTDQNTQPPYLVYIGAGQYIFAADDDYYYRRNNYQVEYYFKDKNEENELAIEDAILSNGYRYTKSDDVPIEDEGVYVIYYSIS